MQYAVERVSMAAVPPASTPPAAVRPPESEDSRHRASAYPISRWYLRPAAASLAAMLAPTRVRPNWLTLAGLTAAVAAAALLSVRPDAAPWAAGCVLLAWFCDRADGQLARLQHSASAWGAWLDANVDELTDLGLHASVAAAAAAKTASSLPWALLIAFLSGKYLLMYGLGSEEAAEAKNKQAAVENRHKGTEAQRHKGTKAQRHKGEENRKTRQLFSSPLPTADYRLPTSPCLLFCRKLYHLPGNADVRIHLLLAALCTGWLTAELALIAIYYNVRWIVRYALVARRLGGVA